MEKDPRLRTCTPPTQDNALHTLSRFEVQKNKKKNERRGAQFYLCLIMLNSQNVQFVYNEYN